MFPKLVENKSTNFVRKDKLECFVLKIYNTLVSIKNKELEMFIVYFIILAKCTVHVLGFVSDVPQHFYRKSKLQPAVTSLRSWILIKLANIEMPI